MFLSYHEVVPALL